MARLRPFLAVALLLAAIAAVATWKATPWSFLLRVAPLALAISLLSALLAKRSRPLAIVAPEEPEAGAQARIEVRWKSLVPGFWRCEAESEREQLSAEGWFWFGKAAMRLDKAPVRRGRYRYRLRLRYRDPLCLLCSDVRFGEEVELTVRPRTVRLVPRSLRAFGTHGAQGASRRVEVEEPSGIRRYLTGDRLALVHWPQTVRTGQLQVRETMHQGARLHQVWLETERKFYPDGDTFELAVSVAASLAISILRAGDPVEFAAGSVVLAGDVTARSILDVCTDAKLGGAITSRKFAHGRETLFVGPAAAARSLGAAATQATVVAVGPGASDADLVIADWPALWRAARGGR